MDISAIRTAEATSFKFFTDMMKARGDALTNSPAGLAAAAATPTANACASLIVELAANIPVTGPSILDGPFFGAYSSSVDTFQLVPEIIGALVTYGNCYLQLYQPGGETDNGTGVWLLNWMTPSRFRWIADPKSEWIIGYKWDDQTTSPIPFNVNEIIHLRSWHPNSPQIGLGPTEAALPMINLERFITQALSSLGERGFIPAGFVTVDTPIQTDQQEQQFKTWWKKLFGRAKDAFRAGYIGGNARWEEVTLDLSKLQLVELRAQIERAICANYRVLPGILGYTDANYASMREGRMHLYEEVVIPYVEYVVRALNKTVHPVVSGPEFAVDIESIPALQRLKEVHEEKGFREEPTGDGERWARD